MESRKYPSDNDENRSLDEKLDKLAEEIKKLPPKRIDQLERLVASMDKQMLSIKETAKILGVSVDTIRRAIKTGSIEAFQINKRGTYRIPIEAIERFMKG